MGRIRKFFRHAFAVEKVDAFEPTPRQIEVVDKLAAKVIRFGLAVPAILFLETARPMNYVGSQTLAFFEPIVRGLFNWREYTEFYQFLEHRGSIELIIQRIEHLEAQKHKPKTDGKPSDREAG